ncbi:MAG: hypothetical protein KDK66_01620 [Deltaproteobacteria bacterium]|nr:hypothetical protein [Deltaproteobacteria bacterium]
MAKEACVYISGSKAFCKDSDTGLPTRNFDTQKEEEHGTQWRFNPQTGRLIAKEYYQKGQMQGRQEYYDEEGQISREEFHEPGKKPTKVWYLKFPDQISRLECGELTSIARANELCGYTKESKIKIYGPDQKLSRIETLWKAKLQGPQSYFDSEGLLTKREFFKEGKTSNRLEKFNSLGKLIYLYDGANAKEFFYHEEGLVSSENFLDDQGLVKKSNFYYQNGQVKQEWQHVNKDLYVQKTYHGVTANLLSQGKIRTKSLDPGEEAKQEGLWKFYAPEGNLEKEIVYKKGVMLERRLFDSEGALVKTESFYPDGSIKSSEEHSKTIAY